MKYWGCTLSEENWKVVQDKRVLGVPLLWSDRMQNVEPGDLLVLLVVKSKPLQQLTVSDIIIPGIYEAVSKPFQSQEEIGFKPYTFEKLPDLGPAPLDWRVKIEPQRISKELSLLQVSRKWKLPGKEKDKIKISPTPGVMEELPKEFFQSIMNQFLPPKVEKCPSCGTEIPAEATFCPACRRRVR
ncbi:MAG: zinc-ribbon domain-containing protein [Dehalococcoidia bacterium]